MRQFSAPPKSGPAPFCQAFSQQFFFPSLPRPLRPAYQIPPLERARTMDASLPGWISSSPGWAGMQDKAASFSWIRFVGPIAATCSVLPGAPYRQGCKASSTPPASRRYRGADLYADLSFLLNKVFPPFIWSCRRGISGRRQPPPRDLRNGSIGIALPSLYRCFLRQSDRCPCFGPWMNIPSPCPTSNIIRDSPSSRTRMSV